MTFVKLLVASLSSFTRFVAARDLIDNRPWCRG